MSRLRFVLFLSAFSFVNSYAQINNISYDLNSSASFITPGHIPFWLRSNQFGSVPLDNASLGLIGAIHKGYDTEKKRIIDWGAAVEGRANIGNKSNLILIEGYAKLRISVFEIRAGRSREIMGLCDSSLSSGAFAVSGNALGIPKVQICIPEFYTLPIFGKLLAFKGNFAHGWIGKTPMNTGDNILQIETYLHQKSLYGRFGKPEWKWKLYGGFNHQVLWGNEKQSYGPGYAFSPLKTYLYVIRGGTYIDGYTRLGDHLGSIDLGFEYVFSNVRLLAYRQNLYDAGALYYLANIRDGLNGLSLVNLRYRHEGFQWKKMLIEVFYTKSQGGETWSVPRPSGAEDYYNHYQYVQGWSYKGIGIGNPFITPGYSTREGFTGYEYFNNNRVIAFHFGYEGCFKEWEFVLKTSYSLNYGTYSNIGLFGEKKQFSAYLDASRELKNGLRVGVTGAFDVGELYYNSMGVLFNVSKTF
jgi:Capsule assembly protein Wzi